MVVEEIKDKSGAWKVDRDVNILFICIFHILYILDLAHINWRHVTGGRKYD